MVITETIGLIFVGNINLRLRARRSTCLFRNCRSVERLAKDKRSNLFGLVFGDKGKKFNNVDYWANWQGGQSDITPALVELQPSENIVEVTTTLATTVQVNKLSRGLIFSSVRPFYEPAVSDLGP